MKFNKKDSVYDFIKAYSQEMEHEEYPKFSTQFLAEKLNMQRTNLSSILNQLVKEGKIEKYNGRPVLYQFIEQIGNEEDCFQSLVGYNGSLKEAVSEVEAAILYPQGNSRILLIGERGTGRHYFSTIIFQYAVQQGVIKASSSMLSFDCKTYEENKRYRHEVLFGSELKEGLLQKSIHGILFLQNIDFLSELERNKLFQNGQHGIILCSMNDELQSGIHEVFSESVDFVIELPPLRKRSIEERFELLKLFFEEEVKILKRNIEVDTSVFHALLLYDPKDNIRGLKNDIHKGCANCYARSHKSRTRSVEAVLADFSNEVRKGILFYRKKRSEIDSLVQTDYKYVFSENGILKRRKKENNKTIYQSIDARRKNLKKQNITEEEIDSVISSRLLADFQNYYENLTSKIENRTQLKKLISEELYQLLNDFFEFAQRELEEILEEKIFYAICLHINGCLVKVTSKQRISNEEIRQMVESYPKEYKLARNLIQKIEEEFRVHLNVDEIIFIILFLTQNTTIDQRKVVTLIVMHGNSAAESMVDVINTMSKEKTTYAYDLQLDKNIKIAYDDLKQKMLEIHQGKGIVLIYDMGSIRTMAESIVNETGIAVKYVEMPITLLGLVISNKAAEFADLNEISNYLADNFQNIQLDVTGNQDKEIQTFSNVGLVRLLNNSDKTEEEILEKNQEEQDDTESIEETFEYLQSQFPEMEMDRIKDYLIIFILNLEHLMDVSLDEDKRIGLIVHIVCLMDQIMDHRLPAINVMASDIINKNPGLIIEIKKLFRPLEVEFDIYISDSEIANIISIINN